MLKEKSRKIIVTFLWAAIAVAMFVWSQTSFQFSYYYAEQLRMFEWNSQYAWSTLLQPMGLVIYFSDFITQFYALPYVGALFTTVIFMVMSLGLYGFAHKKSATNIFIGLCFLPGIILSILTENQYYRIENSLAMINTVILLNLYIRLRGNVVKAITMLLGGWLLYYTSGAAFISFLVLAVIGDLRNSTSYRWLPFLIAIFCVLPIFGLYLHGNLGTAANVFTPYCYMNPHMPLKYVSYSWIIMMAVALLFIVSGKAGRRYNKIVIACAVLVQAVVIAYTSKYFYDKSFNAKNYVVMEADYYSRHGKWKELLECTASMDKNLFLMSYRNYALAQDGRLADVGLSFLQYGQGGLIVPFNNAIPVMLLHTDFNYAIGNIALAQRYAFEIMIQSRNMGAPRMLIRLIQTNLILGAYEVAEKYIERLEHTLYYRDEAHYYRQFLHNDRLVEKNENLGDRRRGIEGLDGTVEKQPTLNSMFRTYQSSPNNKVLFQYLVMLAILEKDLPSLKLLLDIGKGTEMVNKLPTHVQEGMMMYYSEEPENMGELNIDADVRTRFTEFMELFRASKVTQQAHYELRRKYRNSVWYYLLFKK